MSAALAIAPMGLAMPLPAMSGAEPCTGSNMLGRRRCGSRLALAATPRLPARAPPRSERMSANRLEARTTSKVSGLSTKRAAMASTSHCSVSTSGYSALTREKTSSQSTKLYCWALLLVTLVTFLRSRVRASSRSEEHTSELQSRQYLVCRLLLEKINILKGSSRSYSVALLHPPRLRMVNEHRDHTAEDRAHGPAHSGERALRCGHHSYVRDRQRT